MLINRDGQGADLPVRRVFYRRSKAAINEINRLMPQHIQNFIAANKLGHQAAIARTNTGQGGQARKDAVQYERAFFHLGGFFFCSGARHIY